MQWIHQYQLFLFDFDGLLVDTEILHFQAYIRMCAKRGYHLKWDFRRFSDAAHHQATGLRDNIYAEFPELQAQEPVWSVLYEEKKTAFLELVEEGKVMLMAGVAELLEALAQANIKRCVVTHSSLSFITRIRAQNPLLDSIPHWITRENYTEPKPHPECYRYAIAQLAQPQDRVIGFEDSPRGLSALRETDATPVLICPPDYPELHSLITHPVKYYPSFQAITDANFP
ncbi:MAG: HAD family hydrolase [Chlamydiales bacterium]